LNSYFQWGASAQFDSASPWIRKEWLDEFIALLGSAAAA
jgi:hypothetical protein